MILKATFHVGRKGRANHNDRQFDYEKDTHIENGKVKDNIYIGPENGETFKELELNYYKENFMEAMKAQNKKNDLARKPNRNKTIEDVYYNKNTRPEEVILQIGNYKDKYQDAEMFEAIVRDYIEQFEENYGNNCKILDAAIHMDEANIHAHIRRVWFVETENGKSISQTKALEELGVKRPNLDEEENRYNNPKMTLTKEERTTFINICKEHGVQVEKTQHNKKHIDVQQIRMEALEKEIASKEHYLEILNQEEQHVKKISQLIKDKNVEELELVYTNTMKIIDENKELKINLNKTNEKVLDYENQMVLLRNQLNELTRELEVYEKIKKDKQVQKVIERTLKEQNQDIENTL